MPTTHPPPYCMKRQTIYIIVIDISSLRLNSVHGPNSLLLICVRLKIVLQTDMMVTVAIFVDLSATGSRFFLQQFLSIRMHPAQLLGDRVLRPVLLLRQPLDPPDIG